MSARPAFGLSGREILRPSNCDVLYGLRWSFTMSSFERRGLSPFLQHRSSDQTDCDAAITPEVLRRINWTMVSAIPWYRARWKKYAPLYARCRRIEPTSGTIHPLQLEPFDRPIPRYRRYHRPIVCLPDFWSDPLCCLILSDCAL